jgi:hypothetical protein
MWQAELLAVLAVMGESSSACGTFPAALLCTAEPQPAAATPATHSECGGDPAACADSTQGRDYGAQCH